MQIEKDHITVVVAGHVDHGKSTIIGRLIADIGAVPEEKLQQLREACKKDQRPFQYSYLLDALREEQERGITIDAARCFFSSLTREYVLVDVPGHTEFLKNMITGASLAEAAIMVVDVIEGLGENSRRHAYLLSMLGLNQIVVVMNKMDLAHYKNEKFAKIKNDCNNLFESLNIEPKEFIPISGEYGDNIVKRSAKLDWYKGPTLIEVLEGFNPQSLFYDKPLRLPVQTLYKHASKESSSPIILGTVETGTISEGDKVVLYPTKKESLVMSMHSFNRAKQYVATAGDAVSITLQIDTKRGDLITLLGEQNPYVSSRMRVNLFWLGKMPMTMEKTYYLELGTAKVKFTIERIISVLDKSNNSYPRCKQIIDSFDLAECILKLENIISFDIINEVIPTSRFVIIDGDIMGGGVVLEALDIKRGV